MSVGAAALPPAGPAAPPLVDAERRQLEAGLEARGVGHEDVADLDPELARVLLEELRRD